MRRTFVKFAALGRRFRRSRRGSVAIMIGITMPVAIGMLALAAEITFLLYKQRQMQSAADAAALGGATAVQMGRPALGVEARGISGFLGFVDGSDGVTIAVNNPPVSGAQIGNNSAVEVIINQPQTLSLVTLFRSGLFGISARAVATIGGGTTCVLQVSSSASPGVTMNNGAVANLTQCGLAVDSSASTALSMSGAAQIYANTVSVQGLASLTNGAAINPSSALKTSQPNVVDPYAGVTMPSSSGCGSGFSNNKSYGHGNWTLDPKQGVYCKGLSFTNDAVVTMKPGVYFIDRGTFSVGGAVQLTGKDGVTIVLTSSTGSGYATASIGNGANVTLNAPTTGETAGIVFFGDRRASLSNTQNFGGGAVINVNGALYFPTQYVIFQNGANNPSGCTQLIAGKIQLTGGSKFQNNCPAGVSAIGSSKSVLAE